MTARIPPLTVEELRAAVDAGTIDTVVLALTDMQGRLQGKRFHARFFLDEVIRSGSEASSHLLAVDVDMNTTDGYAMTSRERGYGDLVMAGDLNTLRRVPWQPATAMLLADLRWPGEDGNPVAVSPRQILRRQLDRLTAHNLAAYVGTELEFIIYRDSYEDAWRRRYRDLTPANRYNVDHSLLGTARVEPLLRRLRNEMADAGLTPEYAKGGSNLGQHEVVFRYADALTCADQHVIYKNGAKEIAAQEGMSITFMAKPTEGKGNSCHIHFLLAGPGGVAVLPGDGPGRLSSIGRRVVAGMLATMRQFSLFYAPNVNSYKRYQPGSFAPTALRWGVDNRTCALRVVGHETGLRVENRVPGADVNPYLAIAAMVAGAVHGLEADLPLEPEYVGNADADTTAPRLPGSLREALREWEDSRLARAAFGDEVVDHYATNARAELAAFEAAVTDWELIRGFERL